MKHWQFYNGSFVKVLVLHRTKCSNLPNLSVDVKRLLASYTKEGPTALDYAYSTYTAEWGSNPSWETIKKTVVAIGTDYIFLVPTQVTLYLHASSAT